MGKYDDIIHLPHHVSTTRPHMPRPDRAAQFMPFRPLAGYGEAMRETARRTDERVELTEDEIALLDAKLQRLADCLDSHPQVTVTHFQPDEKKAGGAYVAATGQLKKIDDLQGVLVLTEGERIAIQEIVEIESLSFS